MSKQPADQPQKAHPTSRINSAALVAWTMVALVYFVLAAYRAWFSVDKNLPEAATWFALGVCFFCIGLITVAVPDSKAVHSDPKREMSQNGND